MAAPTALVGFHIFTGFWALVQAHIGIILGNQRRTLSGPQNKKQNTTVAVEKLEVMDIAWIMENQMEKSMESEMETGVVLG